MPSYRDIKPGDVVTIKSGSIRMVITQVDGDNATVLWADFDSKCIRTEVIPMIALQHSSK